MGAPKWNPQFLPRLRYLAVADATNEQIAARFGVSQGTALDWCRKHLGVRAQRHTFRIEWTPERDAELRRLLDEGRSAGEVAALWGDRTLRNAVVGRAWRLGLQFRNPAPPHCRRAA